MSRRITTPGEFISEEAASQVTAPPGYELMRLSRGGYITAPIGGRFNPVSSAPLYPVFGIPQQQFRQLSPEQQAGVASGTYTAPEVMQRTRDVRTTMMGFIPVVGSHAQREARGETPNWVDRGVAAFDIMSFGLPLLRGPSGSVRPPPSVLGSIGFDPARTLIAKQYPVPAPVRRRAMSLRAPVSSKRRMVVEEFHTSDAAARRYRELIREHPETRYYSLTGGYDPGHPNFPVTGGHHELRYLKTDAMGKY